MATLKYLALFKLSFFHSLKNPKQLVGLSIFLVTCLLIFANLWKIASAKMGSLDLKADQLLWYIALNEWVLISIPDIHDDMELDFRSGKLGSVLPRPISYLCSIFFEGLGNLCSNLLILGIVSFLFTYWYNGSFPFDIFTFLMTWTLALLAGSLGLIFKMLIGISAFWIHEISPLTWIFEKLLFALGGLILPLAAYPLWLQNIAYFTPFPAILGDRSALVFNSDNLLTVSSMILMWGAIGIVALFLLYRRGLKILHIEGG